MLPLTQSDNYTYYMASAQNSAVHISMENCMFQKARMLLTTPFHQSEKLVGTMDNPRGRRQQRRHTSNEPIMTSFEYKRKV